VAADATLHAASDPAEREREIVGVVEGLVRDLHAAPAGAIVVMPTSRLDRDLGIDSIGRTELMLRIERLLHLKLSTSVLTEVETVGDLIEAIERAAARVAPLHAAAPASPRTLPPVTAPNPGGGAGMACGAASRRAHLTLLEDQGEVERTLTYAELAQAARRVAAGLIARDVEPGDRIALMLPTGISNSKSSGRG
jgi:acyl carrier protein